MNSNAIDLSASNWCRDMREIFRHSPTAFSEFLQQPVIAIGELGFDDDVRLSDGAVSKVSTILASLSALELNQVIEAVSPITYRAGDGGGGGGDGTCSGDAGGTGSDCGDTGDTGDTAGVASAVAVASNVAVVGEVAVAVAAVVVAVYGGAVENPSGLVLSPKMGIEWSPDFADSDAYRHMADEGLTDRRKRALIKQRLIESRTAEGRLEVEVMGKQAWFEIAQQGSTIRVLSGGML